MKTTVDIDLTIDASAEAKICLTCTKKKCTPNFCKRLAAKLEELERERKAEVNKEAKSDRV